MTDAERSADQGELPGKRFQLTILTSPRIREARTGYYLIDFEGERYRPTAGEWKTHAEGVARLINARRIDRAGATLRYVRYLADFPANVVTNTWSDLGGAMAPIYVVQTNIEMIKRCLLMSTDPGDLVLDPTCGSGTTAYVAEQWGRRWITIDTSRVALALARTRLTAARHPAHLLRDSAEGAAKEAEVTGRPRAEGPFGEDIRQGFVLERVPHVTLKSIANNAEIDVIHEKWQPAIEQALQAVNGACGKGWREWEVPRVGASAGADAGVGGKGVDADLRRHDEVRKFWELKRERQKEIDASIARHAETEFLHDKPYPKRNTVRVTGPFTVESLSPHRVLPATEDAALLAGMENEDAALPERRQLQIRENETNFAQVVLENLKQAGVQNTRKGERLMFLTLKPWAGGGLISAEGEYEEAPSPGASGADLSRNAGEVKRKRAAIVIGPEYGTVDKQLVLDAAREARDLFDVLVVCGFAFDPHVGEGTMSLGRLTVLKARMNQELHAATVYKAGGGKLFVVFGEPDIVVKRDDGMFRVEIKGVDIFDLTTGEVRSSGRVEDDIACWFIDTDYDGDSFFVRHAYFLGAKDPFERLKTSLRATIDEDAWATLQRTESRGLGSRSRDGSR